MSTHAAPFHVYVQNRSHGVVVVVVVLEVVDDVVELVELEDELLEVVVVGGDVLLELVVVELVVLDDELLEVVVVGGNVPLDVVVVPDSTQSTYHSSSIYVPGSVGAGPHAHPAPSHELTEKIQLEPFQ